MANVVNATVYRLNTYPLIHLNFLHALLNALALTPLMERFEAENGTLISVAMFAGRSSFCLCMALMSLADGVQLFPPYQLRCTCWWNA